MVCVGIRRGALALAGLCMAASAQAAPLPGCARHIEVSGAKIIRVERVGILVLADGRAVDLEGVVLPRGRRDHAPHFLALRAIDALREMAQGRRATLAVERPKEDRYGRLRAQVFFPHAASESWVQRALLRRGLARVNIAPGSSRMRIRTLCGRTRGARRPCRHLGLQRLCRAHARDAGPRYRHVPDR